MLMTGRVIRFEPRTQVAVLVTIILVQAIGCWFLVDAIMAPDRVSPLRAWLGALSFSFAAEAWGVLIALALSRKSDT